MFQLCEQHLVYHCLDKIHSEVHLITLGFLSNPLSIICLMFLEVVKSSFPSNERILRRPLPISLNNNKNKKLIRFKNHPPENTVITYLSVPMFYRMSYTLLEYCFLKDGFYRHYEVDSLRLDLFMFLNCYFQIFRTL